MRSPGAWLTSRRVTIAYDRETGTSIHRRRGRQPGIDTIAVGRGADGIEVSRHDIPTEGGVTIGALRYRVPGTGRQPLMVFVHGGAFWGGSAAQLDLLSRDYVRALGATVLAIDYRLAPEHPYPAAIHDCLAALRFAREHADDWAIDAARIALDGLSAGGAIAAGALLFDGRTAVPDGRATVPVGRADVPDGRADVPDGRADVPDGRADVPDGRAAVPDGRADVSHDGAHPVRVLVLETPVLDLTMSQPGVRRRGGSGILTATSLREGYDLYAPAGVDRREASASPGLAPDLTRIPPTVLLIAEHDPLRDEAEAFAERLREAGRDVDVVLARGHAHATVHGEARFFRTGPAYRAQVAEHIKRHLA